MVVPWGALALAAAAAAGPAYLGARACRACHAETHAKWDASRHSKMVRPAAPQGVRGDFTRKKIELRGETYLPEEKHGKYFITESRVLGRKTRHEVLYTLGNRRIQHYLTALPDGRIVVLAPSWDVLRREWFHNMEIVGPEPEGGTAVQVWNVNCFGCHVSRQEKNFDLETKTYQTAWIDFGTSCERCHGPGVDHVRLYTQAGRAAAGEGSAIVVQTRLDHVRSSSICAQCHSLRDVVDPGFRAGEEYFDYFLPELEYGSPADHHDPAWYPDGSTRRFSADALGLWLSRCFLEGKLACTGCHTDVHDPEIEKNVQLRPENDALCTRCHQDIGARKIEHTRHPPGSPGSSCVECHMPRSVVSIKAKIRDHGMSLPAPENTERHGIPNACNLCHPDRTPAWAASTLDRWFPGNRERRQKRIERAEAFTRARERATDAVDRLIALAADPEEPPLIRANAVGHLGSYGSDPRVPPALLSALRSEEPILRAIAAPQLGKLGSAQAEAVAPLLSEALEDELRTVRMGAAVSLLTLGIRTLPGESGRRFDEAKEIYVRRAAISPDHAPTQLELGKFHLLDRDLASAAEAFETSLHLDPEQEDAVYYRALARLGRGDPEEAKKLLRKVGRESALYGAAKALLETLSRP